MSIDINNANFKIFTDFAATAKQSARAQLDSKIELNGEMRTVKPAGGLDFIGNVGRLSKHKEAHDTVRNLFRETVTGMFGGEERIPENVLKAMKLEDYGKGKPLTARRITAVKNAIVSFAEAAKADGDKAIGKLFGSRPFFNEMPEEQAVSLKQTIREIFDTCESADARDVLCESIVSICVRGDDSLRSEAEIKAKADAIKANFREIRTAAKGNRQILKAGKFLMLSLSGKSLSQGQIAKLAAFATGKNVKLDKIRRLKSSAGPVTITKALIQYEKNIQAALDATGIEFGALQGDIANPTMEFAARVMLQRLGPSKLRSVQNALTGRTAAQLNYVARDVGEKGIEDIPTPPEDLRRAVMGDREKDIPRKLRDELRDAIFVLGVQKMSLMSAIIGEILDEEPQELPDLPENEAWTDDTLTVLEEVKNYVVEKNGIEITMEE